MTDAPIRLDVPDTLAQPQQHLRMIKWCEGHWSELLSALHQRGLSDQIAGTSEELNAKFIRGEMDPCWEACNMVNVGALEIFGPEKVLQENDGCPLCAFANMAQHAADVIFLKHNETH